MLESGNQSLVAAGLLVDDVHEVVDDVTDLRTVFLKGAMRKI
jgi:hypothetical protein